MNIHYSKQASKAIKGMDVQEKQRIRYGIEGITEGDIKPLKGSPGDYRLRIGERRILFSYAGSDTIRAKKIGPRGGVYKGV